MSKNGIMHVKPKTKNQEKFFKAYSGSNDVIVMHGCSGGGKSFLALYSALSDVLNGEYRGLTIIRSAVPARDIGYLPGELENKAAVYEEPYILICEELLGSWQAYEDLKERGKISFGLTSFLRGLTFDNSIILVDECQNMSFQELLTIITRVGMHSKIIFTGDTQQSDMHKKNDPSGWNRFAKILRRMNAPIIEFGVEDIVRSGLVKRFIIALMEKEEG